jgi:hypothetical protein
LSAEFKRFADEELRAMPTLLAGSTLRWITDGRFQISEACGARMGKPGTAKHAAGVEG